MNFFQQVSDLNLAGDLTIAIQRKTNGNLTISVVLKNEKCGDPLAKSIQPFIIDNHAPAVIDEGFFERMSRPLQAASTLMLDMEEDLKKIAKVKEDVAKAKAAADKSKTASTTPASKTTAASTPPVKKIEPVKLTPEQEKQQKYDKIMADIDKLIAEKKYAQATKLLPEPKDFPDQIDATRLKRRQLNDYIAYGFITKANETPKAAPVIAEATAGPVAEETESTEDAADQTGLDDDDTYTGCEIEEELDDEPTEEESDDENE